MPAPLPRVGARRAVAHAFLLRLPETRPEPPLSIALKALQDPTSRLRELDVLVPQLDDFPPVQAACRRRQQAERAEFMAGLALPRTAETTARVMDALGSVEWKAAVREYGIDPVMLACRVDAQRDFVERGLRRLDFEDIEAVHDLRKRAKALRYVSRELSTCLPAGFGQVGSGMQALQDTLGAWCDARVNAALVEEICGEEGAEAAARFSARADELLTELKEAE